MDIKDARKEIIKRSKVLKEKQRKRAKRILEGMSVTLVALLVFVMSKVPYSVGTDIESSYYGTLLQGRDVGMYIIVGLICFILGVIITMITLKYRDKNEVISQDDD